MHPIPVRYVARPKSLDSGSVEMESVDPLGVSFPSALG